MDRQNPPGKDCIITLQEENSPCLGSNRPELESQQFMMQQLIMPPQDVFLQNLQLEQIKLQQALYQQILMEERPMDLITQQLLQQQLFFNAAFLSLQNGLDIHHQSQTKDVGDNKIKRKHIKKSHNPQYNTGHWTAQEHQMYLTFLQQHKEVMESPELKKTNKIFKLMSDIIKSRSPSQCRSHHQKFNPYSKYLQGNQVVRRKMKEDALSQSQQSSQPKAEAIKIEQPIPNQSQKEENEHPLQNSS